MAKKKKPASRVTNKRAKKKSAKKGKAARKKAPSKKAAKKTTKKVTKAKGKRTAASSTGGAKSVDGVLKKYEKDRAARGTQLASLRKKIDELLAKTRVYEKQITQLKNQENATQVAIEKLDSRRDEEVGKLLAKLGVQLHGGGSDSDLKPPLPDNEEQPEPEAEENSAENSDDSGEAEDGDTGEEADAGEVEEEDAESA